MIFDGRQFALQLEDQLQGKLTGKKVVAILDPTNLAGMTYTHLKKKVAKRLGVEFVITGSQDIAGLNADPSVDGIMVQLPHPNSGSLISQIDLHKDIDGMREDSLYKPAVVKAVLRILEKTSPSFPLLSLGEGGSRRMGEVVIVGSHGFVGRKLMHELRVSGMDKRDFDPSILLMADVVISATGQAGLISPEMVKPGVVAIDLGFPKGDFDPAVADKASFFTPVPGGVGPVTVVSLFENLLQSTHVSKSPPTRAKVRL